MRTSIILGIVMLCLNLKGKAQVDSVNIAFNNKLFEIFENIDYDAKAAFVIERVFERGDVPDIRNCRGYYGYYKVLLNAKFLPLSRIYLASAVINRPIQDFRCYTIRQLNPGLFPY